MGNELYWISRWAINKKNALKPLKSIEAALLYEVLAKRASNLIELLFSRAETNSLTRNERAEICLLIADEYAETGMNVDSEPLPRGLRLEELLDTINRPNLLK